MLLFFILLYILCMIKLKEMILRGDVMLSIDEVVSILITTFLFTVLIVPTIREIAFHVGAIDIPNARKVHSKPMPRLGGLAIFLGFLFGYIFFADKSIEMLSILIGSFIIILTGIFDDIKPLPPKPKLLGQLLAVCVVVFYGNIVLTNLDFFGIRIEFKELSYLVTIFFILGAINCINLIDGLDGLASGVSSIYFATIAVIAFVTNKSDGLDVILSFIMLGSTVGFLVHNFYPAKIFAGDSGSMFLGYIIAIIALIGFKNVTLTSLIIPIIILAIPILDTLFAIIRRVIKRKPINEADKEHLHHQLMNLNLSHKRTVLVIYGVNILFALTSIFYVLQHRQLGICMYIILLILLVYIVCKTNIVFEHKRTKVKNKSKEKK